MNSERAAVIAAVEEADDGGVSPKMISRALGHSVARVAYHVTLLRDSGMIELKRRAPRRGAVEHFYVMRVLPDSHDPSPAVRDAAIRTVAERLVAAIEAGRPARAVALSHEILARTTADLYMQKLESRQAQG